MKTLVIDTSGKEGICALMQNSDLLWQITMPARDLLEKLAEKAPEYDQIAIGIGPGSFTGTRIGVMAAKSLSFATNKPLRPFNSLQLQAPKQKGTLVRDARSNLYYTLNGLIDALPEDAIDVDELEPNFHHLLTILDTPKSHDEVQVLYLKHP